MQLTPEQCTAINAQMHTHFQQIAQHSYSSLPDTDPVDLNFTRNHYGYEDPDVNLMWAGYQFSTLKIVDGKLVPNDLLVERYPVVV